MVLFKERLTLLRDKSLLIFYLLSGCPLTCCGCIAYFPQNGKLTSINSIRFFYETKVYLGSLAINFSAKLNIGPNHVPVLCSAYVVLGPDCIFYNDLSMKGRNLRSAEIVELHIILNAWISLTVVQSPRYLWN